MVHGLWLMVSGFGFWVSGFGFRDEPGVGIVLKSLKGAEKEFNFFQKVLHENCRHSFFSPKSECRCRIFQIFFNTIVFSFMFLLTLDVPIEDCGELGREEGHSPSWADRLSKEAGSKHGRGRSNTLRFGFRVWGLGFG